MRIQSLTQQTIINNFLHNLNWPVPHVLAFTTTRQYPQRQASSSKGTLSVPYGHFNLGEHVGDNLNHVRNNRNLLLEYLPPNAKIQWLEQIHGADVLLIDKHSEESLTADAMITRQKNIALAIMTADCLPILLTAIDGSEIAAIHGGWKPLAKNIIANTVNIMTTSNENIVAWLGPCIGKSAFEVGGEVKLAFEEQSENFASAFSTIFFNSATPQIKSATPKIKSETKYLANLPAIAKIQLNALGINHIHHLEHCTFSDKQQYYSYRRDTITGRMASIICRT